MAVAVIWQWAGQFISNTLFAEAVKRHFRDYSIDPKTVAEILGHASAEFSLDVYTHVTAGMKKAAAQKIGGLLQSVG